MFERAATGDDLLPCPVCKGTENLRVQFHDSERGDELTVLKCEGCGNQHRAHRTHWAYADWNWWAIGEWASLGQHFAGAQLYELLKQEADLQREFHFSSLELSRRIDAELAELVPCPWLPGDLFKSKRWPHGLWKVEHVEALYAVNTGPIWVVRAAEVRSNGRIGSRHHAFTSRDARQLERTEPFFRPARWAQVVAGDKCYFGDKLGTITAVDHSGRVATIALSSGEDDTVRTLSDLRVPHGRFC